MIGGLLEQDEHKQLADIHGQPGRRRGGERAACWEVKVLACVEGSKVARVEGRVESGESKGGDQGLLSHGGLEAVLEMEGDRDDIFGDFLGWQRACRRKSQTAAHVRSSFTVSAAPASELA